MEHSWSVDDPVAAAGLNKYGSDEKMRHEWEKHPPGIQFSGFRLSHYSNRYEAGQRVLVHG